MILSKRYGLFFLFCLFSIQLFAGKASVEIRTEPIRYIGLDSALCGAKIINTGGETIISAGLCWSKSPQPSINDYKVERTDLTDSFRCVLNKLLPQTAYYVRAYVVTSSGITYGPQRTFATDIIVLGANVKGGNLFYVFKPGDPGYVEGEFHGLVASERIGLRVKWNNGMDTLIGALDSTILTGKVNTQKIVNALGNGTYPAKMCDDLVQNGFSDWYLPASEELVLLQGAMLQQSTICWSSTEVSATKAVYIHARKKKIALKSQEWYVIAIRSF